MLLISALWLSLGNLLDLLCRLLETGVPQPLFRYCVIEVQKPCGYPDERGDPGLKQYYKTKIPQGLLQHPPRLWPGVFRPLTLSCETSTKQMLEEDAIRFDTFLKENDKKAHEAIKKAERETKVRRNITNMARSTARTTHTFFFSSVRRGYPGVSPLLYSPSQA